MMLILRFHTKKEPHKYQKGKGNTFSEGDIRVCSIEVFFKQYFGNLVLMWDIE